jgi:hypothetical protein
MIFPTITDRDEWNYLNTLKDSSTVGYPNTSDQGYYARVLRYKYPQCHARLTATTFQILQPGISAAKVDLTSEQYARQRLFDALDTPTSAPIITKKKWLRVLREKQLLPKPSPHS